MGHAEGEGVWRVSEANEGGGAVANACMARGCMVWRVVEGSAGLMADRLVCFASENRVMSRVVWCVGASCVVVEAHVHSDRHVDGWLAWA